MHSVHDHHVGTTKADFDNFVPAHPYFVGIDSDGCVFDSMTVKQKVCFHPLIMDHWHLWEIEPLLRECAEFINLYSRSRGINRYIGLIKLFDMLRDHPDIGNYRNTIPQLPRLRAWIDSGVPLSNAGLAQAAAEEGEGDLAEVDRWSKAVNLKVEEEAGTIPMFEWVPESLEKIRQTADASCISQTPLAALLSEWSAHNILHTISMVAGQELGTKTEHLTLAAVGRYPMQQVLMIGDAPGDLKAAKAVGALFYPINPGHEADSWKRFHDTAYNRFLDGRYVGDYQDSLINEFEGLLPEGCPWDQDG
jgi:phosphoglycolate phosphatase-like HAD superfamily hydrolase